MEHQAEWLWYLAGAICCLLWKWQRYCYESRGHGISFWKASREWFELHTFGSQASWVATIGVVWVIGAVYVDRVGVEWMFDGILKFIPVHVSFAFLLGVLAELSAPAAVKWLATKLPFITTGGEGK